MPMILPKPRQYCKANAAHRIGVPVPCLPRFMAMDWGLPQILTGPSIIQECLVIMQSCLVVCSLVTDISKAAIVMRITPVPQIYSNGAAMLANLMVATRLPKHTELELAPSVMPNWQTQLLAAPRKASALIATRAEPHIAGS